MKKILKILGLVCFIIGLSIGGFKMYQYKEKQKMIAIAHSKEARQLYEDYMRNLDKSALTEQGKIRDYQIVDQSVYYNPMGGMAVTVYLNNNPKSDIQFGLVQKEDGELELYGVTYSSEVRQLLEGER
ncbi:DUF1310 family protein [Streptococcus cuniculi]|uniref:DUF1310 family protein n=1 Tax=Streptococcus cuniculi TaxID=1432788 RepID=A0A4Y9JE98_9STRE|nr:DUF1310 family protein [Streptococcus cuniculi]MBF0777463.1 DUF1310 family protein [Streptococcus cuniculi]TFU98518.1 DUF1310 family protein [Streptococcus cuniculi]